MNFACILSPNYDCSLLGHYADDKLLKLVYIVTDMNIYCCFYVT